MLELITEVNKFDSQIFESECQVAIRCLHDQLIKQSINIQCRGDRKIYKKYFSDVSLRRKLIN